MGSQKFWKHNSLYESVGTPISKRNNRTLTSPIQSPKRSILDWPIQKRTLTKLTTQKRTLTKLTNPKRVIPKLNNFKTVIHWLTSDQS